MIPEGDKLAVRIITYNLYCCPSIRGRRLLVNVLRYLLQSRGVL